MKRTTISALALPLLLSIAACGEDVPANPTWTSDVEEILIANCGRCHGPTKPQRPDNVPMDLRLDLYEGDGASYLGASDLSGRILARAVDYESTGEPQMPPDSYLTEDQKEILRRWVEQGAKF